MCVSPFTIVVESRASKRKRSIDVPCGKCIQCLKQRQNDWKLRICKESESWSHTYFFTLTYRDSVLPCNVCYDDVFDEVLFSGNLPDCQSWVSSHCPDASIYSTVNFIDVRNWLKRFRTSYERQTGHKWNCKYFICSEYGPNPKGTKRPHYHGIFMTDLSYNDLMPMFNEWSTLFGRIQFDECGLRRDDKSSVANYVSKYCAKGCFESRLEDIKYARIKPAYSCMSKNIGYDWICKHSNDWLKYVPSFLEVDGDWDIDLVEEFFVRLKSSAPEDYSFWINQLDNLLLNLCIYDGDNFKYKIPRYFYNILFGRKLNDSRPVLVTKSGCPIPDLSLAIDFIDKPYINHYAYFSSPFQISYVSKMAKNSRYVSSTFLSCAIAYRLRSQFIARFNDDFTRLLKQGVSDIEAFRIIQNRNNLSKFYSAKDSEAKLRNFYESNMWKNRSLDFDADSFEPNLFTNF